MRSKSLTAVACVAVFATVATPAAAEHKRGHHYCASATAGDQGPHGREYRNLHTYNLSCRKGFALMKAFARRNGTPTPGTSTRRINGFRCKARFSFHPEGVTYGGVTCLKGIRKVQWDGFSSDPGGGAGPG